MRSRAFIFDIGRLAKQALTIASVALNAQIAKSESLSCFGKEIYQIHLNNQFGPVKNQGAEGTCYAYAAVAALESSTFRQTGTHYTFDEYTVAVATKVSSQESMASDIRILLSEQAEKPFSKHSIEEGGSEIDAQESILKMGRIPLVINNDKLEQDKVAHQALIEKAIKRLQEDVSKNKAAIEKIDHERDQALAMAHFDEKSGKFFPAKTTPKDIQDTLESYAIKLSQESNKAHSQARQLPSELSKFICEAGHCFIKKVTSPQSKSIEVPNLQLAVYRNLKNLASASRRSRECNPQESRQLADEIMKSLCLGMPMATGLNMKDTNYRYGDGHSMVINGAEIRNGKPVFLFQNSFGEKAPEVTLDFDEACAIDSLSTPVGVASIFGEEKSEKWLAENIIDEPNPSRENLEIARRIMQIRQQKNWVDIPEIPNVLVSENRVASKTNLHKEYKQKK